MHVLLFGASGGIGRHVREQARAAGHVLTLFSREIAALDPLADGERAIAGDIANEDEVAAAVSGIAAVVSALGPASNTVDQVELFQGFARSLVDAMHANDVKRLVSVSGAACSLPGETRPLSRRLASAVVRALAGNVVEAKQRELDVIAGSDLDWIAPRPPRVVDGPRTGTYRAGSTLASNRITQGDLALFMVRQLTDDTYVRQAPFVSG